MDAKTRTIRYEQWIRRMQEWSASGLSKKRYCAEAGINEKAFYYYQRRVRAMAVEQMAAREATAQSGERYGALSVSGSIPSIVKLSAPASEERECTIKLNGVEITMLESISSAFLCKLLEAARNAG